MVVFTLAIGFVQPVTPYCVVLDKNDTGGECKLLVSANEIIRGGALGYLKQAAGLGRRKRDTGNREYISRRLEQRVLLHLSGH